MARQRRRHLLSLSAWHAGVGPRSPASDNVLHDPERLAACKSVIMDLAELLSLPGVQEICELRSAVGLMALHGGSQDRGTHEIASRTAEQTGASYYAIVQPSGLRFHLTSRRHNPDDSDRFRAFLQHVEIAISIHGFGRDGFSLTADPVGGVVIEPYGPALLGGQSGPLRGIIVGGRHTKLLAGARRLLHDRFTGYHVADERIRLGFDPNNPVNLPSSHGVQVELPPGLRGIGDFGDQLVPGEDEMVTKVITALVELTNLASTMCQTTIT
jgi:phage replication-related protein YjqB (UPF0714/DUF867 family)